MIIVIKKIYVEIPENVAYFVFSPYFFAVQIPVYHWMSWYHFQVDDIEQQHFSECEYSLLISMNIDLIPF